MSPMRRGPKRPQSYGSRYPGDSGEPCLKVADAPAQRGRGPGIPKAARALAPKLRKPRCPQNGGRPLPKTLQAPKLGGFGETGASSTLRQGPPPLWQHGVPTAYEEGPPPRWGHRVLCKHCGLRNTATAFPALGTGPPPLWGNGASVTLATRGLRRFGDTRASAALECKPPPLWRHWLLCKCCGLRNAARARVAFGKLGPPPLWRHVASAALGIVGPPLL